MGSKLFYPHNVGDNSIQFGISPEQGGLIQSADGNFEATDTRDEVVTFRAGAVLDSSVMRNILHESEISSASDILSLVIVCKSRESRSTEIFQFGPPDENNGTLRFGTNVSLDRSVWKGEISLQAVLSRQISNYQLPTEYGREKGCKLSWSEERRLFFDGRAKHSGTDIDVRWDSFEQNEDLRMYSRQMFHLDLDPVRVRPVLYMNRDLGERFEELIESTFSPGDRSRDQRTVEAVIQSQVYGLLLTAALESYKTAARDFLANHNQVSPDDEETHELDLRDSDGIWVDSWKKDILLRHAGQICPGESDPEEYIRRCAHQSDDTDFMRLIGNVGDVTQQISNLSDAMRTRFVQYAAEDPGDVLDG